MTTTANVDKTTMGDDAFALQLVLRICRSRFVAAWTQALGFQGTDATIAAGFDSGARLGIPRLPRFAGRYDIGSTRRRSRSWPMVLQLSVALATGARATVLSKETNHVEGPPGAGSC